MKKKIFSIFLSLIIFIGSAIPSFANPLAAGGLIVHLGRIANTLQIGLTAISIVDMGTYLFSRFTIPEQQELINAYNTDVNEFENLSYEKVKSLGKQSINHYYAFNTYRPLTVSSTDVSNSFSNYVNIAGSKLGYHIYKSSDYYYYFRYDIKNRSVADGALTVLKVGADVQFYYNITGETTYDGRYTTILYAKYPDGTFEPLTYFWYFDKANFDSYYNGNLPTGTYDFSNVSKTSYKDLDDEQKTYIKEKYPEYDIESVPPVSDDEPSEESPNFPEFDFGKLDLESLSLSFDNFKNKFPFSVPFDIYNLLNIFVAEPKAPVFKLPLLTETITIDLTIFDEWANIVRAFIVFSWVFVLFSFSKKFGE